MTEWEQEARALLERVARYLEGRGQHELLARELCALLAKPSDAIPEDVARDAVEVCRDVNSGWEHSQYIKGLAISVVERMKKKP